METEIYWRAVAENDARFDGAFYMGVKTTGIYCRPSCRARTPKRENVAFFSTWAAAEASGLRACLRCRPRDVGSADPQIEKIIKACGLLDSDKPYSLEELAMETGLSPYHFQRSFKSIVGISPKKYAEVKRMEKFKQELRSGSDVTTAMYDAGFGSSRGLYENAADTMGMTPATYKKGGAGVQISYTIANTELGKLMVARTKRGICSVAFGDTDDELADALGAEFPNAEIAADDKDLRATVDAIIAYLAGKQQRLMLPLDLRATAFQLQVWELLRKIPYGETRSYGDIAAELGDRKKVRAVARACATNPVALLIPCHRVVASSGKLSGYRWGIERKRRLLDAENSAVKG
jgi:AraC family transcriptional regulator, regulatory protein of adaptative response / methylated-DNA-[protein]-cysteine methyltransferase